MKKFIILSLGIIFILTGCGVGATNTMSCTYKNTAGNITTNMKYDVDYQDKEVKKVRITYDYMQDNTKDTDNDGKKDIPGVGTGTDGTTNDTQDNKDGIVDGVIGNVIDKIVGGVTDTILDIAGLKSRHQTVQEQYGNIKGFSVQNTTDTDNNYRVTYVIDFDTISDTDLASFNLSRNIDTLRDNYTTQGYTCSK